MASKAAKSEVASTFFGRKLVELGVDINKILSESCSTPNHGVSLSNSNFLESEHVNKTIIDRKT